MKKISIILILLIVLVGCNSVDLSENAVVDKNDDEGLTGNEETNVKPIVSEKISWQDVALKNVATNENFKISDFSEKIIILNNFATWTPMSKIQHDNILDIYTQMNDVLVPISVNNDDDENVISQYLEKNNYGWKFAVCDEEFIGKIVNEFGASFINIPMAPVIIICPNGNSKIAKDGIKKADDFKVLIEYCG